MIEVEIRGPLTDEGRRELTELLEAEGELTEVQDRQMILLRGYPGYDKDPNAREVDVRLRDTNGSCEIMVKRKTSDHNVARHEASLPLGCTDLESAKKAVKALGYSEGIWMHRKKRVYRYRDIEWSVVEVPEGLSYYEAEQEAKEGESAEDIQKHLTTVAQELGLRVFTSDEMREFIYTLDRTVNKEITW